MFELDCFNARDFRRDDEWRRMFPHKCAELDNEASDADDDINTEPEAQR